MLRDMSNLIQDFKDNLKDAKIYLFLSLTQTLFKEESVRDFWSISAMKK